jgi:hypothetical protein
MEMDIGENSKALQKFVFPMEIYALPKYIGMKLMASEKGKSKLNAYWIDLYGSSVLSVEISNSNPPLNPLPRGEMALTHSLAKMAGRFET